MKHDKPLVRVHWADPTHHAVAYDDGKRELTQWVTVGFLRATRRSRGLVTFVIAQSWNSVDGYADFLMVPQVLVTKMEAL